MREIVEGGIISKKKKKENRRADAYLKVKIIQLFIKFTFFDKEIQTKLQGFVLELQHHQLQCTFHSFWNYSMTSSNVPSTLCIISLIEVCNNKFQLAALHLSQEIFCIDRFRYLTSLTKEIEQIRNEFFPVSFEFIDSQ